MSMDQKGWFNVWREFKIWYGKLVKEGKTPTWRKQQRQIHDLVMKQITPPVPVTGATNAPIKRGPGRPRKVPMAEAVVAATAAPGPGTAEAVPTPGAHN